MSHKSAHLQFVRVHSRYSDGVIKTIAILDPVKREIVKIVERGSRVDIFNTEGGTSGYMDSGEKAAVVSHFADGRARIIEITDRKSVQLTTIVLDDNQDVMHCIRHGHTVPASQVTNRARPPRGSNRPDPLADYVARPANPARDARFRRMIDQIFKPPGMNGSSG